MNVVLVDDLPLMRYALEDSLGSRPPRGAPQDGPSTYWLDDALRRLQARMDDKELQPFASGNVTYLQLRGGHVEARYDIDPEDSASVDRVPVEAFVELLTMWRQAVLDASPDADRRLPPARPVWTMPPA
ncbi:hypothetical protein [Phycicoccus flavus]|uniref:hypothetical protein n=1 Tax=Phycicoccus flavus TaxID=2502783 RepID=UPI000FEBDECF|nr:hypothetical protein [Phycicoccus flavus]NHA68453.1 hypothetical protein [Phycicoccus flavus]